MAYIRNNLTASHADLERCAGRCKQAAETIFHRGDDVLEEMYLRGADAAIRVLLTMGEGNDEETFITRLMIAFKQHGGGDDE